ncbi:methyltransferase domain protein [Dictyocaulus viviparus]|uniref:tRNA (carboxymethyluridine(34)-5-O)-methyltransferase n=1 Tax=Dictyocaulus viviparus TaxID=29172 RepID=A0A0D8Y3A1_DICVI|nr:methyltransferase domain protein [Dictyocaulus viviparus]
MYFNPLKQRQLGSKLEHGKLLKKERKSREQLRRHDPDVEISEEVTEHLLVSNSSVLCGVSLEELENIFLPFDEQAYFTFFPNKRLVIFQNYARIDVCIKSYRSYSFVSFSSKERASAAREALNGVVPLQLKVSHQPFIISYVKQLPARKLSESVSYPEGLVIIDNYVSLEQEQRIMDVALGTTSANSLRHRIVLHYGYEFDYSANIAVKPTFPIPEIVHQLIDRIIDEGLIEFRPDQLTVNVYEPGQGIPSHYDTHSSFEDPVICLSMCSDVVMEFKDGANSSRVIPVLLRRGSLCLIKGESRYRWKHGIVNRRYDINPITNRVMPRKLRVSLTLRKIRRKPCMCQYKEFCDWDREDALCLPFREVADVVLSVAVLHHIASSTRRQKAIREILRVLKPGGRACISVWAMDQTNSEYAKMRKNKEPSLDKSQSNRLKVHDGKEFVQQDMLVPWQIPDKGDTYLRYYHLFMEGELEKLLRLVGCCQINSIEKEQGNYIAVITKLHRN